MLRRIWINNYKCFVNFEFKPLPFQFIMGANGTGKTALWEALQAVRDLSNGTFPLDFVLPDTSVTRWLKDSRQSFELDVELDGRLYSFQVQIERLPQQRAKIVQEAVRLDGKPIFEFLDGEVHLYDDNLGHKVAYPFSWYQSALATILPRPDNVVLTRFKNWFANMYFIKINPLSMGALAKTESTAPTTDLSNYASWFRELSQSFPEIATGSLTQDLRQVLEGFEQFRLIRLEQNSKLLATQFRFGANSPPVQMFLEELSDGQRVMIALYTILHVSLVQGRTIYFDEPENFVALREIEPWLAKLRMQADDNSCQVLLASHHPEFIDRLATRFGSQFVKDDSGFIRVRPFPYDSESTLTPSELVARGWDE